MKFLNNICATEYFYRIKLSLPIISFLIFSDIFILFWVNVILEPKVMVHNIFYIMFCTYVSVLSSLFWSFLFLLFVSSIRQRIIRNITLSIFVLCWILCNIFDWYVIKKYDSPTTSNVLLSILSTNYLEMREYLSSIRIGIFAYYIMYLLICAFGSIFFRFIVSKFQIFSKCLFLFGIGSIIIFPFFIPRLSPEYGINGVHYWGMNSIERIAYSYYKAKQDLVNIDKVSSSIKNKSVPGIRSSISLDSINIVIVLGESLRRNSMHCYGAKVLNTPNIDSLIFSDELILFEDCVTSGANTALSVPRILSFYNNNRKGSVFDYPTIINAMKSIGCYTFWVSNQDRGGKHANSITAIARSADSTVFTRGSSSLSISSTKPNYDEDLLHMLITSKDLGKKNKTKLFTIIHLMGQHEKFFMRYPDRFNIFIPYSQKNSYKYQIISEYYNSILYGDWILKEIINVYKSQQSIIFFVSDHGINLFDDPDNPNSINHAANKYAAPIPFMVYMSSSFRNKYPDIVNKLKNSRYNRFSSDFLPESICDLLGIYTDYNNHSCTVFSPYYKPPKYRKVIGFSNNISIDTIYTVPDRWDIDYK